MNLLTAHSREERRQQKAAVEAIESFLREFDRLCELGSWVSPVGVSGPRRLVTSTTSRESFDQQALVVARKAGPAAAALNKVGAVLMLPTGSGSMRINPVSGWDGLLSSRPRFTADQLRNCCNLAIGSWSPEAALISKGLSPSPAQRIWPRIWRSLSKPWQAVTVALGAALTAGAVAIAQQVVQNWLK